MSGLKVGDKVKVQVVGHNSLGRLMLSRRPLLPLPESNMAQQQQPTAFRQQNSATGENVANTKVRLLLNIILVSAKSNSQVVTFGYKI